jgi:hypothetical protein
MPDVEDSFYWLCIAQPICLPNQRKTAVTENLPGHRACPRAQGLHLMRPQLLPAARVSTHTSITAID